MPTDLKTLLDYFKEEHKNFSGHFGLAAQRTDSDEPILYHADDIFPTASVMKLVVLVEYFAQVTEGVLEPDQPVMIRSEDLVGGSGVLKDLQPGLQLTLHDIATLSITVSDNTAANLLIKKVGDLDQVNLRLKSLEMNNTTMGRPFIFGSTADNTGSPADFLRLLLAIARHQLINPSASRQILGILSRQQLLGYIPCYLPHHPFAAEYDLPQRVTIANKTGMVRGTANDAAIITTSSFTYALVVFTRDCRDTRADPDNEAALLVARLSKRAYDYFSWADAG